MELTQRQLLVVTSAGSSPVSYELLHITTPSDVSVKFPIFPLPPHPDLSLLSFFDGLSDISKTKTTPGLSKECHTDTWLH